MVDSRQLHEWVDTTLYSVGRAVSEARKEYGPLETRRYIDQALSEVEVLYALVSEIQARNTDSSEI